VTDFRKKILYIMDELKVSVTTTTATSVDLFSFCLSHSSSFVYGILV
jgi:hypothetical protein